MNWKYCEINRSWLIFRYTSGISLEGKTEEIFTQDSQPSGSRIECGVFLIWSRSANNYTTMFRGTSYITKKRLLVNDALFSLQDKSWQKAKSTLRRIVFWYSAYASEANVSLDCGSFYWSFVRPRMRMSEWMNKWKNYFFLIFGKAEPTAEWYWDGKIEERGEKPVPVSLCFRDGSYFLPSWKK
jgi:hypothetical protein